MELTWLGHASWKLTTNNTTILVDPLALEAVQFLKPKLAIPSHFNTWPPIAQDAESWASRVRQQTSSDCRILKPGETVQI